MNIHSSAWHDRVPNHHHLWHRRVSLLWSLSLAFASASAFALFFFFSGVTPLSGLGIKGHAWAGKESIMMCLLARIMCSQLLLLLLLSLSLCAVEAGQWTVRPRRTTTTPRSVTTTTTTTVDRHQHVHHWPPLVAPPFSQPEPSVPLEIRLIDSYDQRSPDGQSEFR